MRPDTSSHSSSPERPSVADAAPTPAAAQATVGPAGVRHSLSGLSRWAMLAGLTAVGVAAAAPPAWPAPPHEQVSWSEPVGSVVSGSTVRILASVEVEAGVEAYVVEAAAPDGADYPGFGEICSRPAPSPDRDPKAARPGQRFNLDCRWDTRTYPEGSASTDGQYRLRVLESRPTGGYPIGAERPVKVDNSPTGPASSGPPPSARMQPAERHGPEPAEAAPAAEAAGGGPPPSGSTPPDPAGGPAASQGPVPPPPLVVSVAAGRPGRVELPAARPGPPPAPAPSPAPRPAATTATTAPDPGYSLTLPYPRPVSAPAPSPVAAPLPAPTRRTVERTVPVTVTSRRILPVPVAGGICFVIAGAGLAGGLRRAGRRQESPGSRCPRRLPAVPAWQEAANRRRVANGHRPRARWGVPA